MTEYDINESIHAYQTMVDQRTEQGWKPYLLTFLFRPMSGRPVVLLLRMEQELYRVYATMLTRLVRKPQSTKSHDGLPLWIAVPDMPVAKHVKQTLRAVTVNGGLHMHAICVVPPNSRIGQSLALHIESHEELYARENTILHSLDCRKISRHDADFVVDYVFKSLRRHRFDSGNILILPRTKGEMSNSETGLRES